MHKSTKIIYKMSSIRLFNQYHFTTQHESDRLQENEMILSYSML